MSRFQELNNNITNIMNQMFTSQNLCKYLLYDTDNPLAGTDIADTSTLLFNKIFPIPKIPDVVSTEGSMVVVILEDFRLSNNILVKDSVICFDVITHIDKWRMIGHGLRPYQIMGEIDELFNNQRVMGFGKIQFYKSNYIYVNEKFSGYRMRYKSSDLN